MQMRSMRWATLLALPLSFLACGDEKKGGGGGGSNDAGMAADGSTDAGSAPDLMTPAQILAYLEGKTLLMTGNDIPTHPNGFSEDLDFGASTQCYNSSTILVTGGQFQVTSQLGTLANNDCDRDTVSATAGPFTSTSLTFSNIDGNADCFDLDAAFTGFAQEGRGRITDNGQTVELELFFANQATGHRCADGAVGSGITTLNGNPFTGDPVQVYRVQ